MQKLILVLAKDSFDTDAVEMSFTSPMTRQEVSDTLSELTTYKDPNDIFSSFHARLLTSQELLEQLNFNDINVEASFFLEINVRD